MLHLIKGPAGSGKTEALRAEIRRGAEEGKGGQLLLVPKQFTFETERALLKLLGPATVKQIEIRSFSRLAQSALQQLPETRVLRFPDAGVKAVLMREALEQLGDKLAIYANAGKSSATLASLVDFVRDLKACRLTYDGLRSTLDGRDNLNDTLFARKLKELLLIGETYDSLLAQSYFDDDTALSQYAKLAEREHPFAEKTVYLDGFRTFTGQEEYIVRLALVQADDVYITICTDEKPGGPFACMDRLESRLRELCRIDGIGVTEAFQHIPEGAFSKSIAAVERALYRRGEVKQVADDGCVKILSCDTVEDECAAVAREIRRLLREENYRCRDIAVIERSEGRYKRAMISALRRLDIPVFNDSRRPLVFEPLFVFMSALLACAANRLTREELFRYLKTGLASLNGDETARLEKYALVWNVDGSAWSRDFTGHPDGFGAQFNDAAKQTLADLNALRRRAVCPLLQLQKDCTDKTGLDIGRAVFAFLEQERVADRLYAEYRAFADEGYPVDADRIRDSWKELTALLDETVALTADRPVSFKKWAETFRLLLETRSAGEIPQGLDEVTVGAADRIRTEQIRAVFLLGVNRSEFPLVNVRGGVLTDRDRRTLTNELGVQLGPSNVDVLDEERFIAYCAVTAGAEKLYLSYRLSDNNGDAAAPSELVEAVKKIVAVNESEHPSLLDTVEGEDTAFAALASCYRGDSDDRATLMAYFADRPDYAGKLRALEAICGDSVFGFNDPANAVRLFHQDIRISATRVNDYYTCPFAYFVKHGLKAYPLDEAKLNAAEDGSVLHYVFEHVLQELPRDEFLNADDETVTAAVRACMDTYLNDKMGGLEGKTPRFVFLFRRLETVACSVLQTMRKELQNDAFTPREFELKIGSEAVPAYTLDLDEGSVTLTGFVDRVDTCAGADRTYLRVLDYKTGKKEFKLSDLLDGINVQMVLYMMALLKSESAPYGGAVPAGVMYMPVRQHYKEYAKTRHGNEAVIDKLKRNARRMSGMVLAEGEEGAPSNAACADYLPDDTFTAEDFALLSQRVDDEIRAMGNALHAGQVPVLPAAAGDKPLRCTYCAYRAVCGYEEGKPLRHLRGLSHGAALNDLREGREETDGE